MTPLRSLQRVAAALLLATFTTLPTSTISAMDTAPTVRIAIFASRPFTTYLVRAAGGLRLGTETFNVPLRLMVDGSNVLVAAGSRTFRSPSITVSAIRANEMILSHGKEERRLAGLLRFTARKGRLQVVNTMPSEVYVLGIVEPELGSVDVHPESVKAQIVASRSYLMSMRGRHSHDGYDFCDGPHCQAFGGLAAIKPQILAVATAVRSKYLSFKGKVIPAFYHDSCGGVTAAAEQVWPVSPLPYLKVVRDGGLETYCRYAPRANWERSIERKLIRRCLTSAGVITAGAPFRMLRVSARDGSGRAKTISFDSNGPVHVSAQRFRVLINRYYGSEVIPSTFFSISPAPGRVTLQGRGWGHGVGLCQWGAMQMAREGKSFEQILQHYYPGTSIGLLDVPIFASAGTNRA
jgi:stage II sporulation protein D